MTWICSKTCTSMRTSPTLHPTSTSSQLRNAFMHLLIRRSFNMYHSIKESLGALFFNWGFSMSFLMMIMGSINVLHHPRILQCILQTQDPMMHLGSIGRSLNASKFYSWISWCIQALSVDPSLHSGSIRAFTDVLKLYWEIYQCTQVYQRSNDAL